MLTRSCCSARYFRGIPREILRAVKSLSTVYGKSKLLSQEIFIKALSVTVSRAVATYDPVNGDHSYFHAATNGILTCRRHTRQFFSSDQNGQARRKRQVKDSLARSFAGYFQLGKVRSHCRQCRGGNYGPAIIIKRNASVASARRKPAYPRQSFFYFLFAAIIDTPRSHAENFTAIVHAERFPPRTATRQEINLGVDPAISAAPGAFVNDQLPIPRLEPA